MRKIFLKRIVCLFKKVLQDDQVMRKIAREIFELGAGLERLKPYLLRGDTACLRFLMSNALKDLGYYAKMAHQTGSHVAAAMAIQSTLAAACEMVDLQALLPELVGQLAKGVLKDKR